MWRQRASEVEAATTLVAGCSTIQIAVDVGTTTYLIINVPANQRIPRETFEYHSETKGTPKHPPEIPTDPFGNTLDLLVKPEGLLGLRLGAPGDSLGTPEEPSRSLERLRTFGKQSE